MNAQAKEGMLAGLKLAQHIAEREAEAKRQRLLAFAAGVKGRRGALLRLVLAAPPIVVNAAARAA